jgi:hypothetical protein
MLKDKDKFIQAVINREWCYLETIDTEMPSWNDILFNIESVRHGKMWRKDPNLNFQMYDTRDIEPIEKIRKYFKDIFYKNDVSAHVYFGISNERGNLGLHKDSMDVIYIQAINEADISVWSGGEDDPERECLFEKRFVPTEMIYLPMGTNHQIKPFQPRASISIGIEEIKVYYPPWYL